MDELKTRLNKAIERHKKLKAKKLKLDAEVSLAYTEVKDIRSNMKDEKEIEITAVMYNKYKREKDKEAIKTEVNKRIKARLANLEYYKTKYAECLYLMDDTPKDEIKAENIRLRRILKRTNENIAKLNEKETQC